MGFDFGFRAFNFGFGNFNSLPQLPMPNFSFFNMPFDFRMFGFNGNNQNFQYFTPNKPLFTYMPFSGFSLPSIDTTALKTNNSASLSSIDTKSPPKIDWTNKKMTLSTSNYKKGDIWNGHTITSTFGHRSRPIAGASTNHKGVDLAYYNNEPIKAFAGGTVINVGKDNGYGNYVDVQDANGVVHRYAHANSISVKKGQTIKQGESLGKAGSTGVSTGPHLHYEKIVNGVKVDPTANSSFSAKA